MQKLEMVIYEYICLCHCNRHHKLRILLIWNGQLSSYRNRYGCTVKCQMQYFM